MDTVDKYDWKKKPVRYAPLLGFYLCQPCWDSEHTRGQRVGQAPRSVSTCRQGECQCACRDMENRTKVKFTAEGQSSIPMDQTIFVGPRS